jgi:hypothetical protein
VFDAASASRRRRSSTGLTRSLSNLASARPAAVVRLPVSREGDQVYPSPLRGGPHGAGEGVAVHPRQADVDEGETGRAARTRASPRVPSSATSTR